MFKISFLLILLGSDSRYSNTNLTGYEKSGTIRTKRSPADGTRKRIPSVKETLFQDEVFGHTPESGGTVRRESWRKDRDGTAHREQMAQAVQERGDQGSGDASGSWTQADHGQLRRGSRPSCDRAGSAERGQGAGGMATGQRKRGQRVDIQAFFISIGARYKRIRKRPRGKPSPHLNIAETLWRILKGKWIRPQDYESTDSLFYATDRALAAIGSSLFVNHSHYAA